MGSFFRILAKPITRFIVGVIAIPLFRMFMRRVVRMQQLDAELEKDMEQWFRGSLVLLVATANMEMALFGWLYADSKPIAPPKTTISKQVAESEKIPSQESEEPYLTGEEIDENGQMKKFSALGVFLMGLRLLLAMSVIEMMPDQELFSIIHPGPPKPKYDKSRSIWFHIKIYTWPMTRGLICQHLNRSSPVFAILCAIFMGWVGWFCYGMAIAQYLIIGLVTSKDKALDALSEFDRQVAMRRRELIDEFDYIEKEVEKKNRQVTDNATEEN
ncbi:MAG: DNA topoisomerase I [Planctomycetaceae bacterium]|nr:DNA topoisomerase I [Planctomycetaceae bacterium]